MKNRGFFVKRSGRPFFRNGEREKKTVEKDFLFSMTPIIAAVFVIENGSCISYRGSRFVSSTRSRARTHATRAAHRRASTPHVTRCHRVTPVDYDILRERSEIRSEEMGFDSSIAAGVSGVAQERRALTPNPMTLLNDAVSMVALSLEEWVHQLARFSVYITLVHVAAVAGFCTVQECKWETCIFPFILWPIT